MLTVLILTPFKRAPLDSNGVLKPLQSDELLYWNDSRFNFVRHIEASSCVHRNRNRLIAKEGVYDNNGCYSNWEIKDGDLFLLQDDDVEITRKDFLAMYEHYLKGFKSISLPYEVRENPNKYCVTHGNYQFDKKAKGFKICDYSGLGARLIHRSELQKLGPEPFNQLTIKLKDKFKTLEDDFAFDYRCRKAGVMTWIDFDNPVNHNWKTTQQTKEPKMEQNMSIDKALRLIRSKLDESYFLCEKLAQTIETQDIKIKELESKKEDTKE